MLEDDACSWQRLPIFAAILSDTDFWRPGGWDLHHRHYCRISFSFDCVQFVLLFFLDGWKTIAFFSGCQPPTVKKAAGEPAARSLVVRWSAQPNSRSCNCAQWNPPFCSITWRFCLTLSQSWIFRNWGLGCVRKKGITMEGQKDCMNPP